MIVSSKWCNRWNLKPVTSAWRGMKKLTPSPSNTTISGIVAWAISIEVANGAASLSGSSQNSLIGKSSQHYNMHLNTRKPQQIFNNQYQNQNHQDDHHNHLQQHMHQRRHQTLTPRRQPAMQQQPSQQLPLQQQPQQQQQQKSSQTAPSSLNGNGSPTLILTVSSNLYLEFEFKTSPELIYIF